MAGSQSQHTMYLNVVPGLLTGISTLTAGLASINTQFQNVTKSVVNDFSVVEGVISAATVLALQFTKSMVDSYAEFEQGMKIVQVVSNQSAEGLEYLKQKSNEFSVQYRMDIDQITEGLQTLGRAGLNTASEQAEVLESGLQTAKLEGRELNAVLQEIIQNTALLGGDLKSDQFGEQSEYVNDLLVATSMTAPITTHDISETLKYSGGIAAAAGANIESDEGKEILTDYMASIAAFAQKGVTGSIAGTALRAFFNKPATQDSSVVEGLSMVGLSPEDLWQDGGERMKPVSQQIALIKKQMDELNISTMDQLQIWSKIVGGKMGQQMMKLDSSDIKELTKDIKSADNASDLANASMKTYQATVKEIGESWQAIQRNIGEHAANMLKLIVTPLSWIMKALSNPYLGAPLWAGLSMLISKGLSVIWKIIQSIKQDVMVFVDMLRGKITAAQNEEITKLRTNIAELKEKHADELEILALKKEELALQEEINSATAIKTGADGTRQVAWNAQQQAQIANLGVTSKMGQVTNMMNAQLQSQNAFRIQSSLYKELAMSANASGKSMGNLVRWINEGMKEIEITSDMVFTDLLAAVDELYGASEASSGSISKMDTVMLEDTEIVELNTSAKVEESAATQDLANKSVASANAALKNAEAAGTNATATEASAAAIQDANTFSFTFTNNLEKLGITFNEMIVLAGRLSASLEAEMALEEAFQGMRHNSINNMMYQNALAMEKSINPATGLPYRNLANASNYANTPVATSAQVAAASAAYQKQMANITHNINPVTSGMNVTQMQNQMNAQRRRVSVELQKQGNILALQNRQMLSTIKSLQKQGMSHLEIASTLQSVGLLTEEEALELARILSLEHQIANKKVQESTGASENVMLDAEGRVIKKAINQEGTKKRLVDQEGRILKTEENAEQMKINASKKEEAAAAAANAMQEEKTLAQKALGMIGGPFGVAMLGLTVAMEAYMWISQKLQKQAQEIKEWGDKLKDATENYETAIDDFQSALKDAYPNATSAEREQMELDVYSNLLQYQKESNGDVNKLIEKTSDIAATLPKYEYDSEKDDGSMKLVEEEISSEEQTQQELDKNTRALMRATMELNAATDAYISKATGNPFVGLDSHETWWGKAGNNGLFSMIDQHNKATGDWNDPGNQVGTFRMSDEQSDENYVGSTEATGLLLENFKDANGNWIYGLRIAMGDSVEEFSEIIPEGSKELLEAMAKMATQIGPANNLRLQLSMRDQKKSWQALAKEVAKYESKNQKSVLKAENTHNKRLEGYVQKLIAVTGGGFTRSQILQMSYLQQMSDMLSVAKEQIVPVANQNMQIAAQNWKTNFGTQQTVAGTGSSTAGTYANAAIIAAYVAQMAKAKAYEVTYNEALEMNANDPKLSAGQKRVAELAQSSGNYQQFMKRVNQEANGYIDIFGIPFGTPKNDSALREVAKVFGAGTYQTVYGMNPSEALKKAEDFVNNSKADGNSIMKTLEKNYGNENFVKSIQAAYLASGIGEVDEDNDGTGAGSGSGSGSGSDKDSDKGSTKNRVDLVLCNKKEIPKLNVNLFKKEPSFTVLNKNFKVRDIKVNTQDKPKAILSSVKNAIIDVEKRTDPKIIQDEAGEYDPVAATEGNSTPTGKTSTTIDS